MPKRKSKDEEPPEEPCNFGPCQFCEYEPTRAFTGDPEEELQPTCDLCCERQRATDGMVRMPEHYVI